MRDSLRAPSLKFAGNRGVAYDGGVVFRGIYSGSVLATSGTVAVYSL